ncbi:chitin synthase-like [Styela clava]
MIIKEDEKKFWNDLIEMYLSPLNKSDPEQQKLKKKLEKQLKDLRNQMTAGYFFINSIWIVLTFSLTMVIQDVNITFYDKYGNVIVLNPLAFLFLIFFAVILIIQFVSMLFHRWITFLHLMAQTSFSWNDVQDQKAKMDEYTNNKNQEQFPNFKNMAFSETLENGSDIKHTTTLVNSQKKTNVRA